jgi:hypothetical protein
MIALVELAKDPYERKARLAPGLFTMLPLLVPLVCIYGARHPILTGLVALLVSCGAMYTLASVARVRGKKLEERLVQVWGGMPTTLALRHRDETLDSVSKRRYHDAIVSKLGIAMPTAEEEALAPAKADDTYVGATKRLRELTRSNKSLLLKENIAYGFHRNMLAMKPIGIVTCLLGLVYGLALAGVVDLDPLAVNLVNLARPGLAAAMTLVISVVLLATWLFYFDADTVKRIGFAYAERLFECLPSLPSMVRKKKSVVVS